MTKLTFFTNTGYSAVNGPLYGSPAAAAVAQGGSGEEVYRGDIEIADVNDPIHLDHVSVPASGFTRASGLEEVDYMRLDLVSRDGRAYESFYYAVTDYHYTSSDVITFQLSIDPFLSFDRVHLVGMSTDPTQTGVYLPKGIVRRTNTPDVLTCPAMIDDLYKLTYPPDYKVDALWSDNGPTSDTVKLIAFNVDPSYAWTGDLVSQIREITAGEGGTSIEKIKPGENIVEPDPTTITFQLPYLKSVAEAGTRTYKTQGYALYYLHYSDIRDVMVEAANKLQALNMGNAVIGAYEVPANMCEASVLPGAIRPLTGLKGKTALYYTPFLPKAIYPDMPWAELMYSCSDFTYTLSGAASGDTISDAAVNCDGRVHMFVDPRPDGRPYFILTRANQTDTDNIEATIANLQSRAVAGAIWNPIAIRLDGAPGSAFAELATTIAQRRIRDNLQTAERQADAAPYTTFFGGLLGQGANMIGGTHGSSMGGIPGPAAMISAGASSIFQTLTNPNLYPGATEQDMAWISTKARARQEAARASIDEALHYISNYGYVAPTIKSQPQTSLQQVVGNGAVFTAQVPSLIDMARFGSIFAMFGRLCSIVIAGKVRLKPLDTAPCVYIQMEPSGVGGGLATEMQLDRLRVGYRFWKKPGAKKDFGDAADYWEVKK